MTAITELRAGVVGTGFIGAVHLDALRRLGIQVAGVVGSTPERARTKALPAQVIESYEALLADPAVDVVHLTTPNHLHHAQAVQALEAGKHVVCEKPLALTSRESGELVALAERSGLVHCTNFNIRFYPICQEARARVRSGELGEIWNVHGGYLQDWLLLPTDWNWRLDPEHGGSLRAVADIGSHWLDLVQFVSGQRVVEVLADLHTFIGERHRPTGEVETFASARSEADGPRITERMDSDDAAGVLLRFDGGARGTCTISQVSAGRRNRMQWEIDGAQAAFAWSSDDPDHLWIGHRGRANEVLRERPRAAVTARCGGDRVPRRAYRGLPGLVPRPAHRGLRRCSRRRTVAAAHVPDVCGRPRRRRRVRRHRGLRPQRRMDEGDQMIEEEVEMYHRLEPTACVAGERGDGGSA